MSPRPAPPHLSARAVLEGGFAGHAARMAQAALHEIGPAGPGAEAPALGFALALTAIWNPPVVFWAGEEAAFAEEGAPYPVGLAQYGLDLSRLIVIRAKKREETLWAAEQGLAAPGAVVICALGARGKALDLKASRRLLLFAQRNRSRCLLLQPEAGPSAGWTRWRIAAAPSDGIDRELGRPAFRAELTRNRAGPAGQIFILDWNAHACALAERALAGDLSAAAGDGSFEAVRAHAGR